MTSANFVRQRAKLRQKCQCKPYRIGAQVSPGHAVISLITYTIGDVMNIIDNIKVEKTQHIRTENNYFWQLDSKIIVWAPYASNEEKGAHILNTCGSYDEWMCFPNELRFSLFDFSLMSISFFVPDTMLEENDQEKFKENISNIKISRSSIKLLENCSDFRFEFCEYKYFDKSSNILYGFTKSLAEDGLLHELIVVDDDVGLIFSNEKLSGWCLSNAPKYISIGFERVNGCDDIEIVNLMLSLFNDVEFEKMEGGCNTTKTKLKQVLKYVNEKSFEIHSDLRKYIADTIEHCLDFYWG